MPTSSFMMSITMVTVADANDGNSDGVNISGLIKVGYSCSASIFVFFVGFEGGGARISFWFSSLKASRGSILSPIEALLGVPVAAVVGIAPGNSIELLMLTEVSKSLCSSAFSDAEASFIHFDPSSDEDCCSVAGALCGGGSAISVDFLTSKGSAITANRWINRPLF